MYCAEYQKVEELVQHYKTKQAKSRSKGTKVEAKKSSDLFCVSICINVCIQLLSNTNYAVYYFHAAQFCNV